MTTPRILIYDIETAPNLGYVWEKWQTNVVQFKEDWYILSFAWKWLGERTTHVLGLDDFPELGYADDSGLVQVLRDLFDEADVTVTHNGKTFDAPKAQTRMLVHGLAPPSPYREVDTLRIARKQFAFTSNRLDDLCFSLGLERKIKSPGFDTWLACMSGDAAAWRKMKRYNRRDVVILEQLYERFLPWIPRHPNMAILSDRPDACPKCGVPGQMQSRGYRRYVNQASRRRLFQCMSCFGWSLGRTLEKTENQFVNV